MRGNLGYKSVPLYPLGTPLMVKPDEENVSVLSDGAQLRQRVINVWGNIFRQLSHVIRGKPSR